MKKHFECIENDYYRTLKIDSMERLGENFDENPLNML